ncbi:hypothetical protein FPV67DRAFT_1673000 [Lyophyllum atratum]|nr:hypothetical protein FPV67DRAFT_1673000 [Lyophyllum atratum]
MSWATSRKWQRSKPPTLYGNTPSDPTNRVLGGSLDVIAVIRTLAVKIQASGQRIQYFEGLQVECGIKVPRTFDIKFITSISVYDTSELQDAKASLKRRTGKPTPPPPQPPIDPEPHEIPHSLAHGVIPVEIQLF